jgi:hypothetical protein
MPHANRLRAMAARGPARYRQVAARGNMQIEKLCNDDLTEVKSSFFRCTWARATYRSAQAGAAATACTNRSQRSLEVAHHRPSRAPARPAQHSWPTRKAPGGLARRPARLRRTWV